jgi:hypothetical protein
MQDSVRALLRKSPLLVKLKRRFSAPFDFSLIDILSAFAAFKPNSAGTYRARARMAVEAVNQTPLRLVELSNLFEKQNVCLTEMNDFPVCQSEWHAAAKLAEAFATFGSDKARNGYHLVYGPILSEPSTIEKIFEIGLGTNNTDVLSNMGLSGVPGASLRAFRDFCPNADVFGADIDKRILFSEDRIKTYFVDQTDSSTFADIFDQVGGGFDLVIDDGLHSPNANIASLIFGLRIIKPGGWVVIEDIVCEAADLWKVVAALLPTDRFKSHIIRANTTLVFAVQAGDSVTSGDTSCGEIT